MKGINTDTACILGALGCVALYLILVTYQRDDLGRQVKLERRRREEAETDARKRLSDLDGALAVIHELRPEDAPDAA
jgi:hypothetical protein